MADPVVLQKIDSMVRCLERIEAKAPKNVVSLRKDADVQDILMLNLERLVQLSVDIAGLIIARQSLRPIPATMADSFDVLCLAGIIPEPLKERMRKAVGFRNLAVHEYDKINWEIVFRIATQHLDDFRQFARLARDLN